MNWTIVALALCAAMTGASAAPAPSGTRTLAQGQYSKVEKPEKVVVRSQAELQKLWGKLKPGAGFSETGGGPPALPKVDWSKEMVLAVFLGARPSAGYKVEVRSVAEKSGSLVARVVETKPPKDAITASVLTQPFHVVAVKKSSLPVKWER